MTVITYTKVGVLGEDAHRDTNIAEPGNVYVGNGQGCGTVWYDSVPQARKIAEKFGEVPEGHHAELCDLCKCHYPYNTPDRKKAPFEHACSEWKKLIARGEFEKAKQLIEDIRRIHR